MTEKSDSSFFGTSNTSLAAYLQSRGFILIEVDNNNPRHRSIFKFDSSPELLEAAQEYESGIANGNVPDFFYFYKKLISKIKDG